MNKALFALVVFLGLILLAMTVILLQELVRIGACP